VINLNLRIFQKSNEEKRLESTSGNEEGFGYEYIISLSLNPLS
jgi:hypothetical protein